MQVEQALAAIRLVGRPEQMESAAASGRLKVNAHIHLPPNFSAFESVSQAVELAASQDVRVVGIGNYYDYEVYGEFASLARQRGIFPLFGTEIIALIDELVKTGVKINDPGNPGKIYVCGKGITRFAEMTAEAQRLLGLIRRNDSTRMRAMVTKLDEVFAQRGLVMGMSESAVIDMVVRRHGCRREQVYLQERHVCQAFQEAAFARVPATQRADALTRILGAAPRNVGDPVAVQNDIRAHLMKAGKPAYVEETFVSFEQAHRLILELGGIPCYPTLADGARPICPFEDPPETLIERIKSRNMWMVEFIPIRNTPEVLSRYVKAMRRAGLAVAAGTEHNTLDVLPIEPACVGGAAVPEDVKAIFWEGACVITAHQFLSLHGECGFVDGQGRPNAQYADDEARIEAMARLGERVIGRYRQGNR